MVFFEQIVGCGLVVWQIVDNALLNALLGVAKPTHFVKEVASGHKRHRVLVVRLNYWWFQVPIFVLIDSTPILCFSRCCHAFGKCVLLFELVVELNFLYLSQFLLNFFKPFLIILFIDVFCACDYCQFFEIDNICIHTFINVNIMILLILDVSSPGQRRKFYFFVFICLFNVWR